MKERPTAIIIFGITGDLAQKKLIPALLDLYANKCLQENFRVIGMARREMTDESLCEYIFNTIEKIGHNHSKKLVEKFLAHISYLSGDFSEPRSYEKLGKFLAGQDAESDECSNKLLYLSVPPSLYDVLFENIANSGLSIPCAGEGGWTRIAVEKPFGRDLETAQALDKKLSLLFSEEQIFRIDHYLAKETLENILAIRFGNAIFDPAWNNKHIDKVHITLLEKGGIGARGTFYEDVGALRDVGQNHILQMLAFIAMDDPKEWKSLAIRERREEVLAHLQLQKDAEIIRAQYDGYRSEDGVGKESQVETYFRITALLDLPKWREVPFVLESGKGVGENEVSITVYFKPKQSCVCSNPTDVAMPYNKIIFQIQPETKMILRLYAKKTGFGMDIEPQNFTLSFAKPTERLKDAYERLLFAVLKGDQTTFLSSKEVRHAWQFITPIMKSWTDSELIFYKKGTRPKAKDIVK
jgi:glucose-6-phosphate 1-dehydrogenase